MTTMAQNPRTSNGLCACGCGASVKLGQRWREPACKARAYRARRRAELDDLIDEHFNEVREAHRHMIEQGLRIEALEQAYSQLWEELWPRHERSTHRKNNPPQHASAPLYLSAQAARPVSRGYRMKHPYLPSSSGR